MKFPNKKNIGIAIMVIIILGLFSVPSHSWWIFGGDKDKEKNTFTYEFPSGWRVVKMIPAWDSNRVNGFQTMFGFSPSKLEIQKSYGNFKLFIEMRKDNYENWWVVVVDIPSDHFLNIPQRAKITMEVIDRQSDTLYIDSQRIAFCKGWVQAVFNAFQHTIFDNKIANIQIRPYRNIGRDDFEHGTVSAIGGKKKFIVGYVYFGSDIPEIEEVLNFSFAGIRCYPITTSVSKK